MGRLWRSGGAGGGGVIGLITSAVVIDNFTWPWVFAAPILSALSALAIIVPMVPNTAEATDARFDRLGSLWSVLASGGIVLGIHEGPEQGWTAPITLAAIAVGAAALVAFVRQERRSAEPSPCSGTGSSPPGRSPSRSCSPSSSACSW